MWLGLHLLLSVYEEFFKFFWRKGKWVNMFLIFNEFGPQIDKCFWISTQNYMTASNLQLHIAKWVLVFWREIPRPTVGVLNSGNVYKASQTLPWSNELSGIPHHLKNTLEYFKKKLIWYISCCLKWLPIQYWMEMVIW